MDVEAYIDLQRPVAISFEPAAAGSPAASDAGMFHEYTRTLFEYQPPEGGVGLAEDSSSSSARRLASLIRSSQRRSAGVPTCPGRRS